MTLTDRLQRILRAVLPFASANEVREIAHRLAGVVSGVGDAAEGSLQRLESLLHPAGGPRPPADEQADLARWARVAGALEGRLVAAEDRARALRARPDRTPEEDLLLADLEWLAGELRAAWGRAAAQPVSAPGAPAAGASPTGSAPPA